LPRRDVPFIVRNLAGVNRKDGADKVLDNQFYSLQNVVHTTKGLLYKRAGTTADLSSSDLYGASKVTAIHRFYTPDKKRYTLYHCTPNSSSLAQPTSFSSSAEISGGDIFNGGAATNLRFCYTWVGLGMESNYNSLTDASFVPVSGVGVDAWSQNGHLVVLPSSNTKGIRVTVPAFPSGVKSANVFMARGTSTQMTYVGTIHDSAGSLDVKCYIGPSAAANDSITAGTVTAAGGYDATAELGVGDYYISLAWVIDATIQEGVWSGLGTYAVPFLKSSKLVTLSKDENQITVSCSHGASTNGAKYAYVFIGRKDYLTQPMVCAGIIKCNGSDSITIKKVPDNSNAQSHPFNSGVTATAIFNPVVPAGNAQNTNRFGFIIKKDENGTLGEVFTSRTEVLAFPISVTNIVETVIRTDNDRYNYTPVTFIPSLYSVASSFYTEPTFVSLLGLAYMVNGVNLLRSLDDRTMGIVIPELVGGTATPNPPVGSLLLLYQNQLVIGGAALGNLLFACNAMAPKNWAAGGTGTGYRYMIVGDPTGDAVTALGVFSYTTGTSGPASQLVALKKQSTWTTATFPDPASGVASPLQNISGRVGCTAYRSLVNTPSGLQFVGSDGEVYLIRGAGEPYRMGTSVKPMLEHLGSSDTLMKKVTAVYHGDYFKISYPSSATSTYNDAELYADMRTAPGDPILWSGPHIGRAVGPQIVLMGEKDDGSRIAARGDALGTMKLDDTSTYQDLGAAIVSKIGSKTYRFGAEMHLKRFMGMVFDLYFDSAYSHSILLEAFADDQYKQVSKVLSTGGAVWDSSSYDSGQWGDALFLPVSCMFGADNILGRTFRWDLTHSDNANFILAAAGILYQPERRQIV
jgi:hypothetical protein